MRGRRSAPLLPLALIVAPVILAQALSIPSFVVPKFADLTIRTRHSYGATSSRGTSEVLYLKGARERREFIFEQPGGTSSGYATIVQCDRRRSVQLNLQAKLYSASVLEDWSAQLKRGRPVPEEHGADVTTTFDAVDTGEQRPAGHYVARRVRTTVTVEPSPGANTPPSTRETDGWYIDLPGLGCSDKTATAYFLAAGEVIRRGGVPDRHHYKTKGAASRGYAIEETTRFTQTGETEVHRVELIKLSEHPLDSSLFDIPRDYRRALPLVRGGYDMSKPDTLTNRLQTYWDEITLVTRDLSLTMAAPEGLSNHAMEPTARN
jgi:hypothetical protein